METSQPPPPPSASPTLYKNGVPVRAASNLGGVCPKCGGASFQAVRSTGRKFALGFLSLLFPADEVRCVMCGERFTRG